MFSAGFVVCSGSETLSGFTGQGQGSLPAPSCSSRSAMPRSKPYRGWRGRSMFECDARLADLGVSGFRIMQLEDGR